MRRGLAAALAVVAIGVPTAAGAFGGAQATGVRGLVTRGPITPVCQEGVPCSAPAKHIKITFARAGVAKTVVTGANGRYSILLAPGTYAVRFPSAKFGFRPRSVVVVAGRMSTRDFSVDTGIR
jgi:hypothetical protein